MCLSYVKSTIKEKKHTKLDEFIELKKLQEMHLESSQKTYPTYIKTNLKTMKSILTKLGRNKDLFKYNIY